MYRRGIAGKLGVMTLLALGILLAAHVLPALAAVGEPIPGAEIFLEQEPGDDPAFNTEEGGTYYMEGVGSLEIPPDALVPGVDVSIAVYQYRTPPLAENGHKVRIIEQCEPDGAVFDNPLTLTLNCPSGALNPKAYGYDRDKQEWVEMACSVERNPNGDNVVVNIEHFSWYGIGWDDDPSPVPAGSPWSMGLLALIGGAGMLLAPRFSRGFGARAKI
jgi:hypothetical protein